MDHALLEWRANTSTNAATFPVHLHAPTSPGTWDATLTTPDEDTAEVLAFLLDTDPWFTLLRPDTPPTEVRVTSFDGVTALRLTAGGAGDGAGVGDGAGARFRRSCGRGSGGGCRGMGGAGWRPGEERRVAAGVRRAGCGSWSARPGPVPVVGPGPGPDFSPVLVPALMWALVGADGVR
nr:hypothetical protein [Streptomyces sp. SID4926]